MAANPTAIVSQIADVGVNPLDATKVDITIEYRFLFIPTASSPPLLEQAVLTLSDNFTKNDLRTASQNAMIASAAAKGATLSSNRIYSVADFA